MKGPLQNLLRSLERRRYRVELVPVIDGVITITRRGTWRGTASDLLNRLRTHVPASYLPNSASHLSHQLRIWKGWLVENEKIDVTFYRERGGVGRKLIVLTPLPTR